MHTKLEQAIKTAIEVLTTTEESYYSASKLKIDEELAEKIIAWFVDHLGCEYHLKEVEDIIGYVYIDDVIEAKESEVETVKQQWQNKYPEWNTNE